MNIKSINTLYPSFVMHGSLGLSVAEDRLLADIAWDAQKHNDRGVVGVHETEQVFNRNQLQNMIEAHWVHPVVQKFAKLVDELARVYLQQIYHYEHKGRIELMADVFCQSAESNTHGMWMHTHPRRPIVVAYYPVVDIHVRGSKSPSVGIDGQANFYDPALYGKRPFINNNRSFHASSIFRVAVESGDFLVFEGYMPHDSAPFEGKERVCIATFCTPKMKVHCDGAALEDFE